MSEISSSDDKQAFPPVSSARSQILLFNRSQASSEFGRCCSPHQFPPFFLFCETICGEKPRLPRILARQMTTVGGGVDVMMRGFPDLPLCLLFLPVSRGPVTLHKGFFQDHTQSQGLY